MAINLKPLKVVAIQQRVLLVFVYLIPRYNPRLFSLHRRRRCKSTKNLQHTQRAYWGLYQVAGNKIATIYRTLAEKHIFLQKYLVVSKKSSTFAKNLDIAKLKYYRFMEFTTEIFELIKNPNCQFYKLYIDDKCQFDEFQAEIDKSNRERKNSFAYIMRMMELYKDRPLLPKEKFNSIQSEDRCDLYEFKHKDVRVYIILQYPNVYIVMGGFKQDQKKDVSKLKRDTKDFPKTDN